MMQDKALKDLLSQFADQREKMATNLQKKFEKHFKQINEPNSGLMSFLIANGAENATKDNEWVRQIHREKQSDFITISNVLGVVSSFM